MIYAAKTKATDKSLTVGGFNGQLLNAVVAFENKAEYNVSLNELFAQGDNLIPLSRKEVVGYMGRNFAVASDGTVHRSYEAACEYDEINAEKLAQAGTF